jgi:C1A family cysteine protease
MAAPMFLRIKRSIGRDDLLSFQIYIVIQTLIKSNIFLYRYITSNVNTPLPPSFDWVPKNVVTPVKDQGM